MEIHEQALQESSVPPPAVVPKPVPPPPPVLATSPVHPCPTVALMTHEEKMEAAIDSANLGEEFKRELGDIKTLVATMVVVGGGLAVAGVGAAATGVGLLVEGVAGAGALLLVAGAAMGGWQTGAGLNALYDFFQETRCDKAQTPQQLQHAGKQFAEGVAKVGIGTITVLLSLFGGRSKNWRGLKIGEPPPKAMPVVPGEKPPPKIIKLFRAVRPEELAEIEKNGKFSNPPGIEVKYFSTTPEGAQSYTSQATRAFGDGPYRIVETSIPESAITPDMQVVVDRGIPTVVVPTEVLPQLSSPRITP